VCQLLLNLRISLVREISPSPELGTAEAILGPKALQFRGVQQGPSTMTAKRNQIPECSRIDHRHFIASALTTGAVAAIDLRPSDLGGGNAKYGKRKSKMPPLSFNSLYSTSLSATSLTGEAADRVAIRELIDAWAHRADRRPAERQAALFTADGTVAVYEGDPAIHKPTAILRGRAEIVSALGVLNKYEAPPISTGRMTYSSRASMPSASPIVWLISFEKKTAAYICRYRRSVTAISLSAEGNRWLAEQTTRN
jgi:hypothetical protein